jgi:hypothetical protein
MYECRKILKKNICGLAIQYGESVLCVFVVLYSAAGGGKDSNFERICRSAANPKQGRKAKKANFKLPIFQSMQLELRSS